jgi:uncharacterized protein YdeI (YjbR/CyaY-like superfamily)
MVKNNPRVDRYIKDAAEFARPVLRHLRRLVRHACPGATENIKWGMPAFEYHGILCGVGAFKRHCTFYIWKAAHLRDPHGILEKKERSAMGQFGQIMRLVDLPADKYITDFIRQAALLNEQGIRVLKSISPSKKKPLIVPPFLQKALKKNKKASTQFDNFSYGHKKEYIAWIAGAKRTETRDKRIATAIRWIADGKGRNWAYEKNNRKRR